MTLPVARSQIITVWSKLAEARVRPSGLIAASQTSPAWPRNGFGAAVFLRNRHSQLRRSMGHASRNWSAPSRLARLLFRVGQGDPLEVRGLTFPLEVDVPLLQRHRLLLQCEVGEPLLLGEEAVGPREFSPDHALSIERILDREIGLGQDEDHEQDRGETGDREGRREGPTPGPFRSSTRSDPRGPREDRLAGREPLQIVGQVPLAVG